jgi:hypothetical protein
MSISTWYSLQQSRFDSKMFRLACAERGIFANVGFNPRNGENNEYEYLLT